MCTAAPRSLAPVLVKCCRKNDRSIPSDIGRRRGADCSAERCRRSWVAHKARCSCTRARRTARIHPCRPIHRRCRRGHWSQTRHQHRPSRWCRRARRRRLCRHDRLRRCCRTRRPIQTRRLRRPAEDTRRRDSRQRSKHRCRARNPDTRPDWARSRRCRHLRSGRPRIPRRRRCRPRVPRHRLFRRLRRRSIHRRHQDRVSAVDPHAPTASDRSRRGTLHRIIARTGAASCMPYRLRC